MLKLHKFIQAKKLGHTDIANEMNKIIEQGNKAGNFDHLCSEVEKLFVDPDRVMDIIESFSKNDSGNESERELLNYLAAQVTDSQLPKSDVLGLTSVINLVSNLQKPVIVHNGMLDLMFMHEKFFAPLPEELLEYRVQ